MPGSWPTTRTLRVHVRMQHRGDEYTDEELLALLRVQVLGGDVTLLNVQLAPPASRPMTLGERLMSLFGVAVGAAGLLAAVVMTAILVLSVVGLLIWLVQSLT